jgi:hypothetical protein
VATVLLVLLLPVIFGVVAALVVVRLAVLMLRLAFGLVLLFAAVVTPARR